MASKLNEKVLAAINTFAECLQSFHDIDNSYDAVLYELLRLRGKVCFTGVGKSGHIGVKCAATFTSTGTPAIFIHSTEASHGDMGIIETGDIVIAISASGSTPELQDIVQYCNRKGITLIGVTRDSNSFLAKSSNNVLILPGTSEACPNRLAPTTSTIAQLALLDALAVTLSGLKLFSPSEFRAFHPGGKLGTLLKNVQEVMAKSGDIPLVDEETPLNEAICVMTEKGFGCCGVINRSNQLVGIYTDGDLRRGLESLQKSLCGPIHNVMSSNPMYIDASSTAIDALEHLSKHQLSSAFVVDKQLIPIGIVHLKMFS